MEAIASVKTFTRRIRSSGSAEVESISPVINVVTFRLVSEKSRAISIERRGFGVIQIGVRRPTYFRLRTLMYLRAGLGLLPPRPPTADLELDSAPDSARGLLTAAALLLMGLEELFPLSAGLSERLGRRFGDSVNVSLELIDLRPR